MTRFSRIILTVVVAGVLIGLTALAAHFLRGPEEASPPEPPPPETVETPTPPAAGGGARAKPERDDQSPTGPAPETGQADRSTGRPGLESLPPDGTTPAEATDPDAGTETVRQALAMVQDRPVVAQRRLSDALKAGVSPPLADRVHQALRRLADRLQLSSALRPGDEYSKRYTVRPGDTLTAIGQRHLVPYPLLMKLNGLETTAIRAGQTLKVIQGPVHVEIIKSRHQLRAWLDQVCLRVYPVGLGVGRSTPEGTFNVRNKITNPPYQPQHKPTSEHRAAGAADNPLGTRWIDIGNHYGIHGTIEPETIGHDASEGCIRMHNKDVEELYDLVVVGASKVYIRP